jgi:transposase InsO family protein
MEVNAIKEALLKPKTLHWSIKSVYYKGRREGKLTISENTMYKMNKVLGIRDRKKKNKKKRHKTGIRAQKPNQYWHADITKVKTLDNKWYCVYLVVDNYSRYILSYEVHDTVSGLVTKSTLVEAYRKAKEITPNLNVNLIVDGGPENNNIYVNGFIEQSEINMKKLIALKDIQKSNSMVERVNMIFKHQYIYPELPRDLKHLKRILRYFIQDYNINRPHGMLNGATPEEAWKGISINTDLRTKVLKQARIDRLAYNRENRCEKC